MAYGFGSQTGGTGATGLTGATGTNIGITGVTGPTGNSGATGAVGNTGVTGATGSGGAVGNSGATGVIGLTGNSGATGSGGAIGNSGTTGAGGAIGNSGATGIVGNTGQTGATGLTGVSGFTGATGLTGNSGGTGVIGLTGNSGATGSGGAIGNSGATGATGAVGTPGTYTETQNTLLGRGATAGTGAPQEITTAGAISISVPGVLGVNAVNNTTNATYYPVFSTTQGNAVTLITSSLLVFNPSTGLLNTSGVVSINNSTASTSSINGALTVSGGIGVGDAVNANGNIISFSAIVSNVATTLTPAASGTFTVNCSLGNFWIITCPNTSNTTITMATPSAPKTGQSINIQINVGATYTCAVTWPSTSIIKWIGGVVNYNSAINKINLISLVYNGSYWIGSSGKDIA